MLKARVIFFYNRFCTQTSSQFSLSKSGARQKKKTITKKLFTKPCLSYFCSISIKETCPWSELLSDYECRSLIEE